MCPSVQAPGSAALLQVAEDKVTQEAGAILSAESPGLGVHFPWSQGTLPGPGGTGEGFCLPGPVSSPLWDTSISAQTPKWECPCPATKGSWNSRRDL